MIIVINVLNVLLVTKKMILLDLYGTELKKNLNIKLHSKPVYDEKYIKVKVKTFKKVVNTVFSDNKNPKESIQ